MEPLQSRKPTTPDEPEAELCQLTRENIELLLELEQAVNREAEAKLQVRQLEQQVALRTAELKTALEAQEQLRINEERWNLALNGTGDGVWDWDAESDLIFLSERSRELIGIESDHITRSEFLTNVLHPEDVPRREAALERPLRGQPESFSTEVRFRTKDRGYRWILSSARVVERSAEGKPLRIVGTHKDIEERHRVQQALEDSNAQLEQFAYVASHDLQEPLRAIEGCTQILAQRYLGRSDSHTDALVSHIVDGSRRMRALIDGLLSLSRVSSQHAWVAKVDTGQIVAQVLSNLEASIESERARISVGELPYVRGEPTLLTQLFQNLVGNALKYHRAEPPQINITAASCAEGYQFSVQDNGIGINPNQFERIFGVFQRLHTREEYPGTGIGLAICLKTVERHGGRIWLDSLEGVGTTFHFTLPA